MGLAVSENNKGSLEETYHAADNLMYKDKQLRSKNSCSEMAEAILKMQQDIHPL